MRSGDPEYRPAGNRTLWLPDLDLPDDLWASFQIPIGLAFFMDSTVTGCVVALYPSPGGATESELHFESWSRMRELNPVLRGLEPDIEGLVVNRLSDPPAYAIAPIDQCYALTGAIKANWEGISGGPGVEEAVTRFFDDLRSEAVAGVSVQPADAAAATRRSAAPDPEFAVLGVRTRALRGCPDAARSICRSASRAGVRST